MAPTADAMIEVTAQIPRSKLGQYHTKMAELFDNQPAGPPPSTPTLAQILELADSVWTETMVKEFKRTYPNRAGRSLMDLASNNLGSDTTVEDVVQASGVKPGQVRSALAGMAVFVKARFNTTVPPYHAIWRGDHQAYRLSPDIARWWQQA